MDVIQKFNAIGATRRTSTPWLRAGTSRSDGYKNLS